MTVIVPDTTILDDLDFDYEPPCENKQGHLGEVPPADVLVTQLPCTKCDQVYDRDFLCCKRCWAEAKVRKIQCFYCSHVMERDEIWKIVREVR